MYVVMYARTRLKVSVRGSTFFPVQNCVLPGGLLVLHGSSGPVGGGRRRGMAGKVLMGESVERCFQ